MTKEEAIEVISQDIPCEHDADLIEALKTAIEALKQEPCDDAISRQTVKEQMIKYGFLAPDMTVAEFVEDLPPVTLTRAEIEPKIGYCKDCKHMRYGSHPFGRTIECSKDILLCPNDNVFCSKYERR